VTVSEEITTEQGELRKSELVQAALEIIAERGFAETRIADVAKRAGTSPALVIYYFKTKAVLLTEAMRRAEDQWYESGAAQVAAFDKASEQLEEIVAMVCLPQHSASASDSWSLWLDLWAQSARNPEVAAVRKEFDEHWRTTLSDIVLKGQQQQEFTHVDSREFAIIFSALLDGLAIQIALDDPVVTNQEAFEISMRFASQSLGFSWNASQARHSSI
jgi:AcrR family transcriptional regulator